MRGWWGGCSGQGEERWGPSPRRHVELCSNCHIIVCVCVNACKSSFVCVHSFVYKCVCACVFDM